MTQPTVPDAAARDFIATQTKEYSTYIATQDIYVGVALAYKTGDPVPVSNVEAHGYDKNGMVAKAGTKAAEQVTGTKNEGK